MLNFGKACRSLRTFSTKTRVASSDCFFDSDSCYVGQAVGAFVEARLLPRTSRRHEPDVLKLDGVSIMTSKAAHVVAAFSCKAALLLLLLLLLFAYAANGSVEAPESVHRRASFQLDTKRLSQAMWLDGAVNHGVPSTFACSSLEGAACLYSAPVRSRFAQGGLAPLLVV
jgi:hypothetical protein